MPGNSITNKCQNTPALQNTFLQINFNRFEVRQSSKKTVISAFNARFSAINPCITKNTYLLPFKTLSTGGIKESQVYPTTAGSNTQYAQIYLAILQ